MAETEEKKESWRKRLSENRIVRSIGKYTFQLMLLVIGGVLASFLWAYIDLQEPRLVYEVFPATAFVSEVRELSIQTLRIENLGTKEAEDVQFIIELPKDVRTVEIDVDPSSSGIKYAQENDTLANLLHFTFPYLNEGESVRFSLLVTGHEGGVSGVELRGYGVVGSKLESRRAESRTADTEEYGYMLVLLAISLVFIGLMYKKKYNDDLLFRRTLLGADTLARLRSARDVSEPERERLLEELATELEPERREREEADN